MSEIIIDIGQDSEEPKFIIEHDDEEQPSPKKRNKWLRRLLKAAAAIALMAIVLVAYELWNYYYNIGIPVSTSPSENIEKLKSPIDKETAEVKYVTDSIFGVEFDLYAIFGLRANIEFQEPDTADASVFLYCRSADHKEDGSYLGTLVAEGKEIEKKKNAFRLGYMAMADNHMVIGVSRFEKVKNYVKEKGGSFFRQFVLVSDGVIPNNFHLHGKVERKAIGIKHNTDKNGNKKERMYFISTRNKETLWDFADALREYGFTDVIYITGGTDYCYYRTANGKRHDIGDINDYPHKKWEGIIPWLVFRKIEQ